MCPEGNTWIFIILCTTDIQQFYTLTLPMPWVYDISNFLQLLLQLVYTTVGWLVHSYCNFY